MKPGDLLTLPGQNHAQLKTTSQPEMLRWGKDAATMQAFKANYSTLDIALKNLSAASERKLFPIPFREISLNAALKQNSGD